MDQAPFRIETIGRRVRAMSNGRTVADTLSPLLHVEGGSAVYYFPPEDVRADLLEPTNRRSERPYRGTAQYWTVKAGDHRAKDAAWAYMDPLPDRPRLKDHLCFYPEKVDMLEVEGEPRGS